MMEEEYTIEQIKSYCSLIDEVVQKAEWVIEKSLQYNSDHTFEIAPLLSIRQMSDYADGVSILILHQSNDSTIPIIRSIFEVSVGLEYLLEKDFDERAKKFLYFYYKQKEIELLKAKKGTQENERFVEALRNDKNITDEIINHIHSEPDIEEKLSAIQQVIKDDIYSDLDKYYSIVKHGKRKYWYSLMNGPSSFKKLVESLGIHSRYHISYNIWSGYAHGWDIINRNLVFEEEKLVKIISKRNPTGSYTNSLEAIMLLRRSLMKYVPLRLKQEMFSFIEWLTDFNKRLENVFKFNS